MGREAHQALNYRDARRTIGGRTKGKRLIKPGSPLQFQKACEVRSADQEQEALPVTGDKKGALPVARRRKR
jgi:hypothetical protein